MPRHRVQLLLAVCLAVVACGFLRRAPPELSADEVLRRSAEETAKLQSFHFRLEALNGAMPLGPGLSATSVEGDAAAPDKIQMTAKARAAGMTVELRMVAIGDRQYLTNPLNGQWQDATGQVSTPPLMDTEHGLASVLRKLDGVEKVGREGAEGVETDHLRGRIPADVLARLVGGTSAAADPVAVDLWIGDEDFLPRRARLVGAVVPEESPQLERSLVLSSFNRPVTIEPPKL